MTSLPPKWDSCAPGAATIPAPEPADYSDELSIEQIQALMVLAPQDEQQMGALVHEFAF